MPTVSKLEKFPLFQLPSTGTGFLLEYLTLRMSPTSSMAFKALEEKQQQSQQSNAATAPRKSLPTLHDIRRTTNS